MALVEANPFMVQIFALMLGCCLGSFYNVVIHRLPLGQSIVSPGSRCPGCGTAIAGYDNIPVLSYLLLRGRCRSCAAPISFRYPLIEVLTGLFALLFVRRYGLHPQAAIEFVFFSLLLIISCIDLDTYTIPHVLSMPGIALGFLLSFFTPRLAWTDSLLGIFLGGGLLYAIATLYGMIRRKEVMGGGDVVLLGMIGAFLGWPGVVFTVLVSSISGMVIALPVMYFTGKGMGAQIPYGPFLAFGAVCYIFWGQLLVHWYFTELLGM
ncbi:MAG: prepilin peptidase [Desulfobacteraceae bacterium]|nr:prepilin peptidase [Desulfobacteraceae bacterium]